MLEEVPDGQTAVSRADAVEGMGEDGNLQLPSGVAQLGASLAQVEVKHLRRFC